ncbi:MAG TPA: ArsR family transcriptional regulator [Methylomirabilota bacterium]|jgi:DeoR family suf operon transcriptional repressor
MPEGTKFDIMKLLLRRELSARSLAGELSVTPTAVRQHLETLYALGLVTRRKVITRPSRPTFLYRLSPGGAATFPKRYDLLLSLFVDVLLERHGVEWVALLVQDAARRLAERVRPRFDDADVDRRWPLLLDWLEEELAWHADVRVDDGHHEIVIHQCPFREVSRVQPAVCGVFFRTLIQALYADVNVEHVGSVTGPACCHLRVARAEP